MNPSKRLKLITEIALKLQSEHNTVQINMLLSGYEIETDDINIVDSKRNYVIKLLKNSPPNLIGKIAFDLGLIDKLETEQMESTPNTVTKGQTIFISHSSKNASYGKSLVEFLTGIGIKHEQIIFTSNVAYGIPIGENIFDWLKSRINEKPIVLYLLSKEYYGSVACLNEMGAAWIVENKNAMIFTPGFDLSSYEFQNGAIDPRKIGFYINDKDRITGFVESLKGDFEIINNQVLINQKTDEFLKQIEEHIKEETKIIKSPSQTSEVKKESKTEPQPNTSESKQELPRKTSNVTNGFSKLYKHFNDNKLKDEELILIEYIKETGRYKLGTGWQEQGEIENIKIWEDLQSLKNTLSDNYATTIRRFEMRKLLDVSDLTSYGNPKELKLTDEMINKLYEHQDEFTEAYQKIKDRNTLTEEDIQAKSQISKKTEDDLPF